MTKVDRFRPSGLAYLFALAFTAQRRGARVQFQQPAPGVRREYLQLTNFFEVLAGEGLQIAEGHGPLNTGTSPGLIKPSIVLTTDATQKNVETSVIVFDRLRKMLAYMDIDGHERAASVFSELSGNAAEHSQSPNGAFVMVQAYPNDGSIEIAVADVGRGIRIALGCDRYQTDAEAIAAALTEQVTGRRDAAGNFTEVAMVCRSWRKRRTFSRFVAVTRG
jgi:hypothetical protein